MKTTSIELLSIRGLSKILLAIIGFSFVGVSYAIEDPKTEASSENERFSENERASTVTSIEQSRIKQISLHIDLLVERKLAEQSQHFNALTSDETFVRRIYLDAIGRIPTLEETVRFLESKEPNKRADLIDDLLDSYGHTSRQFNYWADLLRIKSRVQNVSGQSYIDFVKDSLEENKPYDEFVRQLLVAEGPMMERGNGEVGYYLRDLGMPEDNMSNTVRIFLGTRLECAQCHDHPFDKWTQRQYFEMVAFTGGMGFRNRRPDSENANEVAKVLRDRSLSQEQRRVVRRIILPMTYGISGTGTGLARLPEGFLGDQGDEYDIVPAKAMFGEQPKVQPRVPKERLNERAKKRLSRRQQTIPRAEQIGTRHTLAQWLTDVENPRFARVIANRMWKQALGMGLIEPVDIIEDNTVASNPELMDYLTEQIAELDFDLRQFLRAIYNSRSYQSEAVGTDIDEPQEFYFNGPVLRRMSAEQIWDSMLTMSFVNIDVRRDAVSRGNRYMASGGGDIYDAYEKLRTMTADEILEIASGASKRGSRRRMMDAANPQVAKQRRAMADKRRKLNAKIRLAQKNKDQKLLKTLLIERNKTISQARQSAAGGRFVRASELPSPAPPGHFLREFGQSDREEIENANSDPAVTQVLSLMNGFVEARIANSKETILMRDVYLADSISKKVETVFLAMLNRRPTQSEKRTWNSEFKRRPKEAVGDLIWILVNTNEFIFVK